MDWAASRRLTVLVPVTSKKIESVLQWQHCREDFAFLDEVVD